MSEIDTLNAHREYCSEARHNYLEERSAASDALDWKEALAEARVAISEFFRESNYLYDVEGALLSSGSHALVLRHLLAPPISQDQFKLICPDWIKGSEKSGATLSKEKARAVAATFSERRARRLTPWLDRAGQPTTPELTSAIGATAPLIASQRIATARRNRLSLQQEQAVLSLLELRNWVKKQSGVVSTGGQLPAHTYMYKTKFASGANENQEVDIACGLGGTIVLAMECKVTNDETNSVKRINDILKKASAWRDHWGTFVRPAAVLQGVIKFGDIQRLVDAGVEVFWAHRLSLFGLWLDEHEHL